MSFPVLMPLSTVAPAIAHRIGYRRTVVTGMLLVAAGMALLAALADVDRGYLSVVPGLVVLAVGVGLAMSPSTNAITASLPVEKQGVVSALNHTAREMGAALGIALVGSILNAQYRANISDAAAALPPNSPNPSERASVEPARRSGGARPATVRRRPRWARPRRARPWRRGRAPGAAPSQRALRGPVRSPRPLPRCSPRYSCSVVWGAAGTSSEAQL